MINHTKLHSNSIGESLMRILFSRSSVFAVVLLMGGISANAQQTASIPNAVSMQPTVNLCAAGEGLAGTCVPPTGTYLTSLVAQNLPAADFSQSLADFVVALAALAQADEACTDMDSEVAEAIKLASTYALDPAQRASFFEIGETIGSCTDFQTAAITPASPN